MNRWAPTRPGGAGGSPAGAPGEAGLTGGQVAGATRRPEPARLAAALFRGERPGGYELIRDLHDLWLLAGKSHISWEVLAQAAHALQDRELETACEAGRAANDRQVAWLRTRIGAGAPQALVVPT